MTWPRATLASDSRCRGVRPAHEHSWPAVRNRVREAKDAIIARRGAQARNIAKVAAARQLLTLIFYGLRDGHIRCLAAPVPAA